MNVFDQAHSLCGTGKMSHAQGLRPRHQGPRPFGRAWRTLIDGGFAYEHWNALNYLPGQQTVTTSTIQVTWFPERKISF